MSQLTDAEGRKLRVLCLGRVLLDVITAAKRFPPPGAAANAGYLKIRPGGGAYYSAQAFVSLGDNVCLIATIGKDPILEPVLNEIRADTSFVKILDDQQTPWSIVCVDDDGTARYLLHQGIDRDIDEHQLSEALNQFQPDIVFIANINQLLQNPKCPIPKWLRQLKRESKIKVVVDMSKDLKVARAIWQIAPYIDILIGNQYELAAATEEYSLDEIRKKCRTHGIKHAVIVKLGQFGSYYGSTLHEEDSSYVVPGFTKAKINSEIGAGDVFAAVVAHQLTQGRVPQQALEDANLVAACHIVELFDIHTTSTLQQLIATVDRTQFSRSVAISPKTNLSQSPEFCNRQPKDFDTGRALSQETIGSWLNLIKVHGLISKDSFVVDAGCGTGRFSLPIASEFRCKFLGIDIDEEAVSFANKKCKALPDCKWLVADLAYPQQHLTHYFGRADCIWISSVIQEVEPEAVAPIFSTLMDLLKPKGRLLIRFTPKHLIDSMQWAPFIPEAKEYAKKRYKSLSFILDFLIETGFKLLLVSLVRDEHKLPSVHELLQRWKKGYYIWSHYINENSESDIRKRLDAHFREEEVLCWDENYLIVCEKQSGGIAP